MENTILHAEEVPVTGGARRKYVGAVEQALSILRCLSDYGRPMGVSAVTRATGLNASTVFAILRTLVKERLVDFDESGKTYVIGIGVLEFSVPLLGRNQTDLIRPSLEALAVELGVPVVLWRITKDERIVLVDRARPPRVVAVEVQPGWRLPAFAGAVGRCYAGQCYARDEQGMRRRFGLMRWHRPPAWDDFRSEALESLETGYAVDRGFLFSGLTIVGTLIRDGDRIPRFGLSVMSLAGQVPEDGLVQTGLRLVALREAIEKTMFGAAARSGNAGSGTRVPGGIKKINEQDNFTETGEQHERILEA